ncbi:hypothetical protein QWZ13_18470 [Reinekea marina]|uniref:hypothetical protein n=1 Tax=Reinekea marina TaxID=1310421 RepID=UPI0025B49233|nr:hypothetical protein [Reinekea marina]MDN3650897.1 hypothetical protein [Reinekea marina]
MYFNVVALSQYQTFTITWSLIISTHYERLKRTNIRCHYFCFETKKAAIKYLRG